MPKAQYGCTSPTEPTVRIVIFSFRLGEVGELWLNYFPWGATSVLLMNFIGLGMAVGDRPCFGLLPMCINLQQM
ncbi:hypothetical protein [Nostoc sp. DSM 114161]|uniref:hypothetical protein n=1 Tax=Nostoc sp. DSM 114161 TaxID=3440143 RepID=UPI0040467274